MARFSDGYSGFAGNADQQVRERQFLVGEPGALGAKQHRGRAARAHLEDALARPRADRARGSSGRADAKWWRPRSRSRRPPRRRCPPRGRGASRSSAPEARAVASGCGNALGRTSTSSASAMFFMARATAPMFPGCEGSTSTMRMAVSGTACIIAALFGTPPHPMQPLLNIAVNAARRAGDIIVRAIPRLEAVEVQSKGRNDFVTEVDKAAEADIIETIRRLYPDHAIPRRGKRRVGRQRSGLDHRSARWHHELHARLSDLRRVHRLPDPGPPGTRGGVRSHAPGDLHRLARRRRAGRRPQDARQQADHAGRLADRHRLPVSRRLHPGSTNTSPCSRR